MRFNRIEDLLRRRSADASDKLKHPEPGNPVARILTEAQDRKEVLHMRGIQKLQPTKLYKGDLASG